MSETNNTSYDTSEYVGATPRVEIDPQIAGAWSVANVNVVEVARLFSQQGMSNADITGSTIILSAEQATTPQGVPLVGRYNDRKNAMILYLGWADQVGHEHLAEGPDEIVPGISADEVISSYFSRVLKHEMKHRLLDALGPMRAERLEHIRRYTRAQNIGIGAYIVLHALAVPGNPGWRQLRPLERMTRGYLNWINHHVYLTQPEERVCREFADQEFEGIDTEHLIILER